MSQTLTFPGSTASRRQLVAQPFACTLRVGDLGPAWVQVAGELDVATAPRLAQPPRPAELRACRPRTLWRSTIQVQSRHPVMRSRGGQLSSGRSGSGCFRSQPNGSPAPASWLVVQRSEVGRGSQ
jgi:hypothetical protein